MTRYKLLLLVLMACSILFFSLLTLASYFWTQSRNDLAVICFLLSFLSTLGQFAALAKVIRERARMQQLKESSPDRFKS